MEHIAVLRQQIVTGLALRPGDSCIDGTVGGGGHAEAILAATAPMGRLLGLDADPAAIGRVAVRLAPFGERVTLAQANFARVAEVAAAHHFTSVAAALLDLGISSHQLGEGERGFSLQVEGPLDMRMDPATPLTADEIVNEWGEEALADVIFRYGEEHRSRRIARYIIAARPLHTTTALAQVISRALGGQRGPHHPATQAFQALRIRVNDELGALEAALPQLVALLAPAGRLAVITFHSLEDRIVKRFMQQEARDCICTPDWPGSPALAPVCRCGHRATLRVITRKPIQPDRDEVSANPRSRSAKLRIAEKIG